MSYTYVVPVLPYIPTSLERTDKAYNWVGWGRREVGATASTKDYA